MKDFEKEIKVREQAAIQRDLDYAKKSAENNGTTYEPPKPVSDLTDSTKAVESKTGRIGEEHAPADPNINQTPPPATAEQPSPTSTPESGNQEADSMMLTPVSANQSKKTSFLDPDLEKGLWDTLDKKVKEALSGGTPEEIGQNMAFAFLTFFCELVANYADHIRHERKRLEKDYKEKTAEWDKNMGVTQLHKNLAIWAAIADHPAMREFANKPVTNETVRAAYNLYRTDKNAQKTAIKLICAMTGREITKGEANTYFESAFKTKMGGTTLSKVKGLALNDAKFMEGLNIAHLQKAILSTHQQVRGHQDAVRQNQADRDALGRANGRGPQPRAPQQTHTDTRGRDAA